MISPARDGAVAHDAYNDLMHSFRGSYHFESNDSLDRALTAAREYVADDELTEVERRFLSGFRRRGQTLEIDAMVPLLADRYVITAVLGTLAWHARDGFVEAYRGQRLIDRIISAGAYRELSFDID